VFGEPPRTQYDLNFSVLGIPVRIHPWFWLITLMLAGDLKNAGSVLIWVAAVLVSILVHELGHALVMRAYGLRPWITLYGLGGLASYDYRFASSSRASRPLAQVLISVAGPVAGFLLAGGLVLGLLAAGRGVHVFFVSPLGLRPVVWLPNLRLAEFFNDIFFVSVLWGMVNLLPIYPLDGGQIAREVLVQFHPREGIRTSLRLSIVAAAAMAVIGFTAWNHDLFILAMFGYLAYSSYVMLRAYDGRNA
jgi:Zn-dependent protease